MSTAVYWLIERLIRARSPRGRGSGWCSEQAPFHTSYLHAYLLSFYIQVFDFTTGVRK
jgi:hypothetical protein